MNISYARGSSKDQNLDRQIAAISLRNDAVNKIKSTVGTIGTCACGGHGSRTRFSSDVDCSLKQEGIIVRMDKSNSNEFEARPPLGGG